MNDVGGAMTEETDRSFDSPTWAYRST